VVPVRRVPAKTWEARADGSVADCRSPRRVLAPDAFGSSRARSHAARVTRLGRVVLGLFGLVDGLLRFQPYMSGKTFVTGVILPSAAGQPGIIASPITLIANLIEPHVVLFDGSGAGWLTSILDAAASATTAMAPRSRS